MKQLYLTFKEKVQGIRKGDEAVTAVEYGLIAAGTSVVIIAALDLIGPRLKVIFDAIAAALA